MARLSFSRTVVKTICTCQYVDQNNVTCEGEIELFGNYDIDTAQNAAKKALNAKGCVVTGIKHESFYGTMSMNDFTKYCEKSNFKEW